MTWKPPVLESKRLILRPLEMEDAPDIFAYAKNPNVSRYTLWEPHQTIQDAESYLRDYVLPFYEKKTPEPWGVALKSNPKKIIGTVGVFWVSSIAKSMELAYAIAEPHWGQGIVPEAAHGVMSYAFREFDLERIQSRCKVENEASIRVMQKLGMQYEGTLRSSVFHRDRYWDIHYYAVLKSEWGVIK